jgi:hypothetical protein
VSGDRSAASDSTTGMGTAAPGAGWFAKGGTLSRLVGSVDLSAAAGVRSAARGEAILDRSVGSGTESATPDGNSAMPTALRGGWTGRSSFGSATDSDTPDGDSTTPSPLCGGSTKRSPLSSGTDSDTPGGDFTTPTALRGGWTGRSPLSSGTGPDTPDGRSAKPGAVCSGSTGRSSARDDEPTTRVKSGTDDPTGCADNPREVGAA